MNGVYNRKLFAKKATQARDKLREMGGVQPMPAQMGGIMASSPELMQAAAMRRPVVLPTTQAPVAPTPAPQPMTQMLPPSQPIPNIAGIPQGPAPTAPAPRPMAQKPGVKKMNEGGILDYTGPISGMSLREKFQSPLKTTAKALQPLQRGVETPLTLGFKKAFEFGQKAVTSTKAEDVAALPAETVEQMQVRRDEIVNQPEVAAQNNVAENVPEDQRTGNLQKDLVKAAENVGLTEVPAEAKIDQLNKAIAGAQLGAALAGNYVNPNTGQELRPTAGARIASAAAQGLALARDTETRRAKQEAALAAAKMKAAGKGTSAKDFLETPQGEAALKMFQKRVENNEDPAEIEALMNEQIGNNIGTRVRQAIAGQAAPAPTPTSSASTYPPGSIINQGGNRFRVDDNGVPQLIQGE